MNPRVIKLLRVVLPIVVLVVAAVTARTMVVLRPEPETRVPEVSVPQVRVVSVRRSDLRLTVSSQGTVAPRNESQLVPEVSGRVISVSPALVSGGFFEAGQELLRIDSHDYQQALVRAEGDVATARLRLAQEQAEAQVARREWADLGKGDPSALTLREPQVADARAAQAAAEANLETAKRNLERTELRAPYAGRVRQKMADVGQFVSTGTAVASIYSVDVAEIRLPLPDSELAYLDLPLDYRGVRRSGVGPKVLLRADFAGRVFEWEGRIVRTEGEIDPATRMVHAIAEVRNPYGRTGDPDRPPLAVGMYVEAEVEGRLVEGVTELPRGALRGRDQVLVVDANDRLRFRTVDLLRATSTSILVRSGLAPGERICLSPLETATEGMKVRVVDEGTSAVAPGTPADIQTERVS